MPLLLYERTCTLCDVHVCLCKLCNAHVYIGWFGAEVAFVFRRAGLRGAAAVGGGSSLAVVGLAQIA